MSRQLQPPPIPNLTPQFCFNTRLLRDFLRISRSQLDDTISTNLNSLLTPSTTRPFDPESTAPISSPQSQRNPRRRIPSESCSNFTTQILFPTWQSRTAVLSYCASVATSPDPDDPDVVDREVSNRKDAERIVDERLDPYSSRFFPKEARTEQLASVLRNENMVEGIVRRRTWAILNERCDFSDEDSWLGGNTDGWEETIGRWRDEKK